MYIVYIILSLYYYVKRKICAPFTKLREPKLMNFTTVQGYMEQKCRII